MTKPSAIALVVCDNVYTEPGGKRALVGLFNSITCRKCPTRHARMCVFVSVTAMRPATRFKLDMVHAESDESVMSMEGPPPEGSDPTTICDFTFLLENIVFRTPGRHFIRFWGNDHLLLQRPFEVVEREHDS